MLKYDNSKRLNSGLDYPSQTVGFLTNQFKPSHVTNMSFMSQFQPPKVVVALEVRGVEATGAQVIDLYFEPSIGDKNSEFFCRRQPLL